MVRICLCCGFTSTKDYTNMVIRLLQIPTFYLFFLFFISFLLLLEKMSGNKSGQRLYLYTYSRLKQRYYTLFLAWYVEPSFFQMPDEKIMKTVYDKDFEYTWINSTTNILLQAHTHTQTFCLWSACYLCISVFTLYPSTFSK